MTLYVGLMSGTSMDGIDAALVQIPSNKMIHAITKKYSEDVRQRIKHVLEGKHLNLASLCQLNTLIGREFAAAVSQLLKEAKVSSHEIKAIGSHGQTICHDTSQEIPYTLQLGCGHTISSLTGITVVADFRTRDIVNGGQGAPFAPLYHRELFTASKEHCAVVNVGGISNITFLASNGATEGWDVGPGNCLMDAWIEFQQGLSFDKDGSWAAEGEVIDSLLTELLADSFLSLKPPKSIGKEYYSLSWLNKHVKAAYKAVDIQATLTQYTAQTIAAAVLNNRDYLIKSLYLCGGGTHNKQLQRLLKEMLPEVSIRSSAEMGVDPDYLEAMMFAWYAANTINQTPVNLAAITGSKGVELLGAIYPMQPSE